MDDLLPLLASAEAVVRRAGQKLVELQGTALRMERKDLLDIVTEGDLAAEEIVVAGLRALTPHAAFLAEERGASAGASGERWIIDPLDGTVNYACGLPWYSVTVAYEVDGAVLLGITHAPRADVEARFVRDRVATVNGQPARVTSTSSLADAVVSICLTSHFARDKVRRTSAVIERLGSVARGVRVVVSGAFEMALVASGRLDGFINLKADAVSHATGNALVRAAGGRVTDLDGADAAIDDDTRVASNGVIHDELLEHIREALAQGVRSLVAQGPQGPCRASAALGLIWGRAREPFVRRPGEKSMRDQRWGLWAAIAAVAVALVSSGTMSAAQGIGDGALVSARVKKLTRGVTWKPVGTIPVKFNTQHPQGMVKIGDTFYVSSVEIRTPTKRYPQLQDGYDRDTGEGAGHLFKFDASGTLITDLALGDGSSTTRGASTTTASRSGCRRPNIVPTAAPSSIGSIPRR
jgi:fructose-1,6-bisphosphatase/inositol monophosphatase family enzyme